MQRYLFWASLILLLGLSISQELPVPCKSDNDCAVLQQGPSVPTCQDGQCKCKIENGTMANCGSINANTTSLDGRVVAGLIGRVCSLDVHCSSPGSNAHCNTTRKQCACNPEFVSTPDTLRCLPAVQYLKSGCEIAKQCLATAANTTCLDGVCRCEENFHHYEGACWAKRGFGSTCNVTQECTHVSGAVCNSLKLCGCPIDTVIAADGASCLPIVTKIEDPCTESIQCTQLLGDDGVCQDKHCKCREHHHHSKETNKCAINKKFNDQCEMDYECSSDVKEGNLTVLRCITVPSSGTNKTCGCSGNTRYDNSLSKCVLEDKSSANRVIGGIAIFSMTTAYFIVLSIIL